MIFEVNEESETPKFQQLVDSVTRALAEGTLDTGDQLPSVNTICKEYRLSRDTVFKAYNILKEKGTVQSVPNKGYFIAKENRKVFLFLDTFKAYKEVLYGGLVKNLSPNIVADVHFHHYNTELFKRLVEENAGKYSKYIVMPFDNPEVGEALKRLPANKTLIIDWDTNATDHKNRLYQNFGTAVRRELEGVESLLRKYTKCVMLYPEFTFHPKDTVENFEAFCKDKRIPYEVQYDSQALDVKPGEMYFSVSDRMLGMVLEQCKARNLELGADVGVLSYNETPMKKFVDKGITVISTDFEKMGEEAARFSNGQVSMDICVPTKITLRESL
ncbi:GntR family transcriptional regulator [Fulvitalea axinellae]|uniref:GntR family transcriptional regulator n=1 Tax=Fulvitalea axinellae TaxID=1182444 RepID=A0AAU9CK66_9BACT|nr:GntR family transcriptional regulator [Fulvitalea axinellae]